MPTRETDYYFRRFRFCERQIAAPPEPDLGIVIVIPCFNEPDLIGSLESLWLCERPECSVEVVVIVNSPADCGEAIRWQNQAMLKITAEWIEQHHHPRLVFHTLHFPGLPANHAGVGLARKIGMDEALRRFDDIGRMEGIIAGYDADCRCETNYLSALKRHFHEHPRSPGCSIYFEHPLKGQLSPQVYEAAAAYELHLRYYVQGLRCAGFPHAHHTLGSCMAVRSGIYREQGGMNKRKAGEDFYFLHKIIALGGFTDLTSTTVYPSPRPSDRVPFGTGKAVRDILSGAQLNTYPFDAFLDLKQLVEGVPELYRREEGRNSGKLATLPASVRSFLAQQQFDVVLAEIRENTSTEDAFHKRFFRWLDGFRAMKFVHHARDHSYGEGRLDREAARLLATKNPGQARSKDLFDLLKIYRGLDRWRGAG
ncbi:MAG TPA: glycosyltransferase family A protein [Desulfuromonadaceae bacterium]|nr:glycosyltransferase family A protein [Desulfuromonadaceae bacterium]